MPFFFPIIEVSNDNWVRMVWTHKEKCLEIDGRGGGGLPSVLFYGKIQEASMACSQNEEHEQAMRSRQPLESPIERAHPCRRRTGSVS